MRYHGFIIGSGVASRYGPQVVPPGPAWADGARPIRFFGRAVASDALRLACPRCGSRHTEQLSAFGSTACKSTWRCLACKEPFEHFKAL